MSLGELHGFEAGHALQDERLALQLLAELRRLGLLDSLHDLVEAAPLKAEDLLSCAAILHDIGYAYGYEDHHKRAFQMIVSDPAAGISACAVRLIAHIARYHRGKLPDPATSQEFARLSAEEQAVVQQLAAILRLSDGLDRSHTNAVQRMTCQLERDHLIITLSPGINDEAERWAGQKKSRFLADVLSVPITIR